MNPRGRKPRRPTLGRIALYAILVIAAVFFLLPFYVMIVTSLKTMPEIQRGNLFALPAHATVLPWITAWAHACTGVNCGGIRVGVLNSFKIMIPSVIISILLGAINGYVLSFWRPCGGNIIFAILLLGAFIPYQVYIYPLVRMLSVAGLYDSLGGIVIVHTVFGLPVMTLLFRNSYLAVPKDLFKAARVDGGGFWTIFFQLMLPMSGPILVVAMIVQVTGIWNDFLFGLIFAGRDNLPMTVELNNVVNTTTGTKAYDVDMAATILTALVPLIVYFASGRWFVRGIAAGAVKG